MPAMFPVFLDLDGRDALVVGGGAVAESKTRSLLDAGARVTVVAPSIGFAWTHPNLTLHRRAFHARDLKNAWFVIAAATPAINHLVANVAEKRQRFVIAVDDKASCSAYAGAVVRRSGVTVSISTDGAAPALSRLLREALAELLPADLDRWRSLAVEKRREWRAAGVPMERRYPLLLQAVNQLYEKAARG